MLYVHIAESYAQQIQSASIRKLRNDAIIKINNIKVSEGICAENCDIKLHATWF